MADTPTLVADVLIPDVWSEYLTQEAFQNTLLYKSGLVTRNPRMDQFVGAGGSVFNVPFSNPLTGDDTAIQSGTDLEQKKIATGKQQAVRLLRGANFAAEDIANMLAGNDFISDIEMGFSQYWDEMQQKALVAELTGFFADNAANDFGDLIKTVVTGGAAPTDTNLISSDYVIDAYMKKGDKSDADIIVMHSIPYARLQKLNLIDFQNTNVQQIGWGTYLGMTVFVCDNVPAVTNGSSVEYTTYIAKRGAVLYGESANNVVPFEVDRDGSRGITEVITRRNYAMHIVGSQFTSASVAGDTPTNAELETVGNWNRVFDRKNIGVCALITNG